MKGLILIEDHDGYGEPIPIGIASNMEKAREMRDEYFASKLTITEVRDIRDGEIEYIELYTHSDGDKGKLIYRYFNLNEI